MDSVEALLREILGRRGVHVAALAAALVLLPLCTLLGARLRWGWARIVASACTALSLSLVAAVTLGRRTTGGLHWPPACENNLTLGLGGAEGLLNLALFMPAAFFAVLTLRRGWVVLVLCGLIIGGIETTQSVLGNGSCQTSDLVRNFAGAAVGAALGVWLLRLAGPDPDSR